MAGAPVRGRRRSDRRRLIARRIALSLAAVPVVAAGGIIGADHVRKLRDGPQHGYPWERYTEVPIDRDDHAVLYSHGRTLYDDMVTAIMQARHEILIESFIWKGDHTGQRIRDALVARAREGVAVRVIFDGFANMVVPRAFRAFPPELQVLEFRPLRLRPHTLLPRTLFRDHRKLLVVDGDVAFVGGFNIGDRYQDGSWRDTHIRLRGPAVAELHNVFADFWNSYRPDDLPHMAPAAARSWDSNILVDRNDPQLRVFPIRNAYLEAIDRSRRNVWITQAYFIPDRAFRKALVDAAARGVDVQVILPWHSNHVLADWVGRRRYGELLGAGVRLNAYRDVMIHGKTATIDGVWSTVGTANIDRLSLAGNYEVNVEIRSTAVAEQMEAMFRLDRSNCMELDADAWNRRPTLSKALEHAVQSFAPFL